MFERLAGCESVQAGRLRRPWLGFVRVRFSAACEVGLHPKLSHPSLIGGNVEDDMGCWVITGRAILDALKKAHAGETPDIVYAELYANCTVERVEPDDA